MGLPGRHSETDGLAAHPATVLEDFRDFLAGFVDHKLRSTGPLLVLSPGAFAVADHPVPVRPDAAALAALARIARLENPQLMVRCLDSDSWLDSDLLAHELADNRESDLAV
jgi:hypothetical protein